MPFSNSVLRRYTPPTCTLEIAAKDSPLSRWASRPVLKNLRFQLSFDDPRLPQDQQVSVRGDRTQLEALCEVVEAYVQNFLDQSPARLDAALLVPNTKIDSTDELDESSQHSPATPLSDEPRLSPDTQDDAANALQEERHRFVPLRVPSQLDAVNKTGISLQPKGLLSHNLSLGTLANETSSVVHLSTLQLFDLATALDEYAAEALAIPTLNRPRWITTPTGWARSAAVVLIALGVTTSLVRVLEGPSTVQTSAPTTSESASSQDQQQVAVQISPEPEALTPFPSPPGTLEALPPLPPPGSATPLPNAIPTVPVPVNPPRPSAGGSTGRPSVTVPPEPILQGGDRSIAIPEAASRQSAPSVAANSRIAAENEGQRSLSQSADSLPELSPADTDVDNPAPTASSDTAFDTLPQVAEARSYFQQRWQPPAGVNQVVEYSLLLNPDGSIQQINPLGEAAGIYLDRTGMPLLGEAFVSPLPDEQSPRIRIVLRPDGSVQTFLEAR